MTPRRRASSPVLIYCEGLRDATFLRLLNSFYGSANSAYAFTVKTGAGGSPASLVQKATLVTGSYDLRITKLDNDRGEDELREATALAVRVGVGLCVCTPCIEGTFLQILEPGPNHLRWSTKQCKDRFRNYHLGGRAQAGIQSYQNIFSKSLLDDTRQQVPQLDAMIRIFEQGRHWAP